MVPSSAYSLLASSILPVMDNSLLQQELPSSDRARVTSRLKTSLKTRSRLQGRRFWAPSVSPALPTPPRNTVSCSPGINILEKTLHKHSRLDLAGLISMEGSYSDVFVGNLKKEGKKKQVSIKHFRIHMQRDSQFLKVSLPGY